jgi:AIPR protein
VNNELVVFSHEFQQHVLLNIQNSDVEEKENCFTEYMISCLIEDGTIEDGIPLYFKKRGIQINGYFFNEDMGILNVFISKYNATSPPVNVPLRDIKASLKRLNTFLEKAINAENMDIPKGTPIFDLVQKIFMNKEDILKINVYFLTDGIVKKNFESDIIFDSIDTEVHIWDLERLYTKITSGKNRESVEIDFDKLGGGIPCLEMPEKNETYETYLAIFPAILLVEMYSKYRTRLLEGNVRSFLQLRGSVNKGIRSTLKNEPHMFLAYNNGISAVAESACIVRNSDGLVIKKINNLQIVNGGQTTATLYHVYKKDRITLKGVSVQVKLTIVSEGKIMDEVVPKISEYANSQNKIQGADFSSNHIYHRTMEELSRTVWAPVIKGAQRQTKWYYERARGQYLVDRGKENSLTYKRNFDNEYPPKQKFDKTALAKYMNTFHQKPYMVSRGAQKNFNEFMNDLNKNKTALPVQSDYENIIALVILNIKAEQQINTQKDKYPAYRSYIVAYSLAWIFYVTSSEVDLKSIWINQDISKSMVESLNYIFPIVNSHIINPPSNGNITEWCKRKECWDLFLKLNTDIPNSLLNDVYL